MKTPHHRQLAIQLGLAATRYAEVFLEDVSEYLLAGGTRKVSFGVRCDFHRDAEGNIRACVIPREPRIPSDHVVPARHFVLKVEDGQLSFDFEGLPNQGENPPRMAEDSNQVAESPRPSRKPQEARSEPSPPPKRARERIKSSKGNGARHPGMLDEVTGAMASPEDAYFPAENEQVREDG